MTPKTFKIIDTKGFQLSLSLAGVRQNHYGMMFVVKKKAFRLDLKGEEHEQKKDGKD
ncbi:MAG: hypothetical protein PVG39_11790 [Desulfobacteraceae bacterium]|jgi:hypothetical protein